MTSSTGFDPRRGYPTSYLVIVECSWVDLDDAVEPRNESRSTPSRLPFSHLDGVERLFCASRRRLAIWKTLSRCFDDVEAIELASRRGSRLLTGISTTSSRWLDDLVEKT